MELAIHILKTNSVDAPFLSKKIQGEGGDQQRWIINSKKLSVLGFKR